MDRDREWDPAAAAGETFATFCWWIAVRVVDHGLDAIFLVICGCWVAVGAEDLFNRSHPWDWGEAFLFGCFVPPFLAMCWIPLRVGYTAWRTTRWVPSGEDREGLAVRGSGRRRALDGALAACLCPALAAPLVLLSAYSVSLLRSEYPQGGPTPEAFGLFAVLIGWLAHSVGLVAAFGANRSDPARDGWLEWIPWMEVGLVVATIVAMSFAMEIFEGFLGKWSAAAAVALLAWSGLLGAYYGVRGYLAWRRACRIRE